MLEGDVLEFAGAWGASMRGDSLSIEIRFHTDDCLNSAFYSEPPQRPLVSETTGGY